MKSSSDGITSKGARTRAAKGTATGKVAQDAKAAPAVKRRAAPVDAPKPTAVRGRPAPKTSAKRPRESLQQPPAPQGEPAPAAPAKMKLLRDSFTIPKDEYAAIDALKVRAARLGRVSKKSELLRAGLKKLLAASDDELMAALAVVPSIKTGRPPGKRKGEGDASPK